MSISFQSLGTAVKKYPILWVCGFLAFAMSAILYLRSDLQEGKQAELDKLIKEGNRYRSNISNSAQLQEQLDFLMRANEAVRARALRVDGLAENLQYLYRLESEEAVKYLDLRPGAKEAIPKQLPAYVPINYNISVQGTYSQVIKFTKRFEQGAYFARINAASASGNGSSVTFNLTIDLLGVP